MGLIQPVLDLVDQAGAKFLAGGGEMGARMRAHDWAGSPLGPPQRWPQSLRTVLRLMLSTNHPIFVFWGPEHICFYNDAYSASLGPEKHPAMLGARGREKWEEIWPIIGPQIELVMAGQGATWHEDHLVPIIRHGRLDEVYWTYGYSPIDDEGAPNGVGGVLVICSETTGRVLQERRLAFHVALDERLQTLSDPTQMMDIACRMVGEHLAVARVGYGLNDEAGAIMPAAEYTDGQAPSVKGGRWEMSGFGPEIIAQQRAGRTLAVEDVAADPRIAAPEVKAVYDKLRVQAFVSVPLVKDGRWIANFYAGHSAPRRWTEAEIALLREVAERTWAAVERARAEAALRQSAERLRLIQDAGGIGSVDLDLRSGAGFRSAEYNQIQGLSPDLPQDAHGQDEWLDRVHSDDREKVKRWFAEDLARGGRFERQYRIVRPGSGEVRWLLNRGRVEPDADGRAVRLLSAQTDITEQKRTEAALRDSEARLRAAVLAAPFPIMLHAEDGEVIELSRKWTELTGYSREEIVTHHDWGRLAYPDDYERFASRLAEEFGFGQEHTSGEWSVRTRSGEIRTWTFYGVGLGTLPDGRRLQMSTAVDVTDRRRAEAHQELLIGELNHRVKNTLATVQSIAAQTLRQAASLELARENLEGRLMALARAHDVLTRGNWESADLQEIVTQALEPFRGGAAERLSQAGPSVRLPPAKALAFAMAIQELATNAVKYGALSNAEGRVEVSWLLSQEAGRARVRFLWAESDGPPVEAPTRRGFGARMLEVGLARDLGGEARLAFASAGLRCEISAPL